MYLVAAVSAGVDIEPLVAWLPLQPPEAAHAVALVDDHESIEVLPLFTTVGVAARLTEGAGAETDTVADCAAFPPGPEHVSVYVELVVNAPVDCEPLVDLAPDHAPPAVQEAAFVEDQVRVELAPLVSVLGLALNVTVGAGADTVTVADCAALPPAPVHVRT